MEFTFISFVNGYKLNVFKREKTENEAMIGFLLLTLLPPKSERQSLRYYRREPYLILYLTCIRKMFVLPLTEKDCWIQRDFE